MTTFVESSVKKLIKCYDFSKVINMNLMNNNALFNRLIKEVDDLRLAVCLDKAKKNNI